MMRLASKLRRSEEEVKRNWPSHSLRRPQGLASDLMHILHRAEDSMRRGACWSLEQSGAESKWLQE